MATKFSLQAILALLAGALLPLAFAPLDYYGLAILSPAILLWLWQASKPLSAVILGWLYGLAAFGMGINWVYISIHVYGNTNVFLAGFITCSFIAILACFPSLLGYLLKRYFAQNNSYQNLLAFPALWTLLEWLRSWIFTGFPWLLLAHSQTHAPLRGFIPLFGVLGTTWCVALSSALCVLIFYQKKHLFRYLILLITLWSLAALLSLHTWTYPSASPLRVSLIQGNIPQEIKWEPTQVEKSFKLYQALTQALPTQQVIIWPEAAITAIGLQADTYLTILDQWAQQNHSALITGFPLLANDRWHAYNALLTLGNGHGLYRKRFLVPFGEYVPWEHWLRGLLDFFDLPMSEFISGPSIQRLPIAANIPFAPFICYEIAYAKAVRSFMPQAQFLVVISNDAWFGHSWALAQHLQIAQFYALATGRYAAVVSNTGLTALVKSDGTLAASLKPFQIGVLQSTLQPYGGSTPWVAIGSDQPWLYLAIFALAIALLRRQRTLHDGE